MLFSESPLSEVPLSIVPKAVATIGAGVAAALPPPVEQYTALLSLFRVELVPCS